MDIKITRALPDQRPNVWPYLTVKGTHSRASIERMERAVNAIARRLSENMEKQFFNMAMYGHSHSERWHFENSVSFPGKKQSQK